MKGACPASPVAPALQVLVTKYLGSGSPSRLVYAYRSLANVLLRAGGMKATGRQSRSPTLRSDFPPVPRVSPNPTGGGTHSLPLSSALVALFPLSQRDLPRSKSSSRAFLEFASLLRSIRHLLASRGKFSNPSRKPQHQHGYIANSASPPTGRKTGSRANRPQRRIQQLLQAVGRRSGASSRGLASRRGKCTPAVTMDARCQCPPHAGGRVRRQRQHRRSPPRPIKRPHRFPGEARFT